MRSANRSGFVETVLSEAIPMTGRMIHGRNSAGSLWEASQDYDVHGRVSCYYLLYFAMNRRLIFSHSI